jgi:hypothetical protein
VSAIATLPEPLKSSLADALCRGGDYPTGLDARLDRFVNRFLSLARLARVAGRALNDSSAAAHLTSALLHETVIDMLGDARRLSIEGMAPQAEPILRDAQRLLSAVLRDHLSS